jgi:hypothetical protein
MEGRLQEKYSLEVTSCETDDVSYQVINGLEHRRMMIGSKYMLRLHNQSDHDCFVIVSVGSISVGCFGVNKDTTFTVKRETETDQDLRFTTRCAYVPDNQAVRKEVSDHKVVRTLITALFVPRCRLDYLPKCIESPEGVICYRQMNLHGAIKLQVPISIYSTN